MSAAGFYKRDRDQLLYGPNAVYGPRYTLRAPRDAADGWSWFADEAAARVAYGLPTSAVDEVADACAAEGIADSDTVARVARVVERVRAAEDTITEVPVEEVAR